MAKKYILKRVSKNSISDEVQRNFKINYEQLLNPAQLEAVKSIEGNYLLIAGAGTGKTRTLVYRVARLIELGYDPRTILLLTFTRKAAREMMNRASVLLDNRCSLINGGTFHSFANLTLRKFAKHVGLDNNFSILDQTDSEDVINLIRTQLNFAKLKKRFPNKKTIYKVLSLSVNTDMKIEDILAKQLPHFLEYTDHIKKIDSVFKEYKFKNNLLDYDDLLIYLRKFLFDLSPAAKGFLEAIKFTMVDEYQDTNYLQADIIKGLSQINENIMVVGDDSQSIYSFRGADFKNIINFPNLFANVKIIKLEENYRSTQSILNLTNKIIENAIEKYDKELFTSKAGGDLPAIISAKNENLQSRFIVDKILELREEGISLSDIAILFRSSYHSFDLEIELNKANIPYIKFGGMKFIETAHIKDILAFLRIIANPKDVVSWYRVLMLHEGIGPKKAQRIIEMLMNGELNIYKKSDVVLPSSFKDNIYNLFSMLNNLYNSKISPSEKANIVVDYYHPIFKDTYDDYNKRKKDIEIFMNITENYSSLESLLSDMALDPPRDSVSDLDEESKENEFLTLSTIHSAKGLEWHSVFIINVIEGFFPSSMSADSIESIEEERRLMYVATTRAKKNLFITYPMSIFDRFQGYTLAKPSRFIKELNDDLKEEWLLEEE